MPYPENTKWLLESEIAGLLISSKIYRVEKNRKFF